MNTLLTRCFALARQHYRLIVGALFVAAAVLGLALAPDYGLSWDEPLNHHNGQISLAFVLHDDPELWTYSERYYGTIYEMVFAFLQERVIAFDSTQSLFIFRHAVTFLFFLVGVFFFYRLCFLGLRSQWLALLGAVFLIASPRIFADAFYNSKDIPALILFIVSVFTLLRFLETPSYRWAVWHALATALLLAIRLPGLFIPAMTLGFVAANLLFLPEERHRWKDWAIRLLAYFILAAALTVLFWPFLWRDPIGHFAEAYADMSRFSRQVGLFVMYQGGFITAGELPWHYIPVWMSMTTPFLYLVLGAVGMGVVLSHFRSGIGTVYRNYRQDLVVLAWFLGPILSVIVLGSVLYDGWRHLYFVYPALVYLAVLGSASILGWLKRESEDIWKIGRTLLTLLIGLQLLIVVSFMVRNHPYQNLYFNFLAGGLEGARENFDLDYWGLTFREGLEYIAATDSDEQIPIAIAGGSPDTLLILRPEQIDRFILLDPRENAKAKYILSNYRWQVIGDLPFEREVYAVRVDGVKVMSVFKMR